MEKTTVKVDRFGRVLLPKAFRTELGLTEDTRLRVQIEGNSILLKPERKPVKIELIEGVPVFETDWPVEQDPIKRIRQDRDRKNCGLDPADSP